MMKRGCNPGMLYMGQGSLLAGPGVRPGQFYRTASGSGDTPPRKSMEQEIKTVFRDWSQTLNGL